MAEITDAVNPLASDTDKNDPKYGLKLMKAAVTKWQEGYNGESRLARKNRFDYNRAFAMGRQPMDEYKDILDLDGELSVVNIPFDQVTVVVPYLNKLKDRYNETPETIQCYAIDPFTQQKKKAAKDNAIFKLQQGKNIQALQQNSGVQLEEFSESDPKSEEEIDIFYGFAYKEAEEILMEDVINVVFNENDWFGVLKDRLLDDLINCGYAGTKTYIDGTGRIKIRYIKPENLITSYCEWNDFRDWQYLGETYYMSVMEIRLKYPGKISEEELYKLSTTLVGKYGNPTTTTYSWNPMYYTAISRPYDAWRVPVCDISFKTLYNISKSAVSDKFGKEVIVDEVLDSKKDKAIKIESNPYYVEYSGVYIIETNHILEWGLSKNMVKPNQNLEEIISPFTLFMYNNTEMSNKPMMETIIPLIKQMQLARLQQLKIIAAAAPDGFTVDIAVMSDIELGGKNLSPVDLYKIYKQSGIQFYKSIPDEGLEGGNRQLPINPLNVPFSAKLEQLMGQYNAALLEMTNIISNELDAGNIRNQAVSQTVVEQAQQIAQSSSNFLYKAYLNIMKRTAKVVQLRGWDILMYGKKWGVQHYDGYRQAIGENKIKYVKAMATDDWSKTAFDILIKTVIGNKDEVNLENNIQQCLAQQTITLSDALDVRELANINTKYASRVLAQRIEKREKQIQENQMQLAQQNTQAANMGAQVKAQGDMALQQAKESSDIKQAQLDHNNAIVQEREKFNSILKVELLKSVLAKPDATMKDIPSFVFEGLPLDKAIDHATVMQYLQNTQQQIQQQAVQGQQQDAAIQQSQQPQEEEQPTQEAPENAPMPMQ